MTWPFRQKTECERGRHDYRLVRSIWLEAGFPKCSPDAPWPAPKRISMRAIRPSQLVKREFTVRCKLCGHTVELHETKDTWAFFGGSGVHEYGAGLLWPYVDEEKCSIAPLSPGDVPADGDIQEVAPQAEGET